MKDYYQILGVDEGANKEEIKKAYKVLAKKYHPDHGGDVDKFKEINEAHNTLSDDRKRKEYDNPLPDFFGPMSNMFGGFRGFGDFDSRALRQRVANMPRRGQDLRCELEISLYDAICGGEKEFNNKFRDICPKCEGIGGINKKACGKCGGNGVITNTAQQGNVSMIKQTTCLACGGRGFDVTDKCDECGGVAVIERKEKVILKLKPGIEDGVVLRLAGKGGIGLNGGPPGDLLIRLKIKMPRKEDLAEEQLEVLKVI